MHGKFRNCYTNINNLKNIGNFFEKIDFGFDVTL